MVTAKEPKPAEPPPWRHSNAKELLKTDILQGKVANLTPEEVYHSRPEFKQYKKENFKNNLRSLQRLLAKEIGRALWDDVALTLDKNHRRGNATNSRPYPRWNGSTAEALLREDVQNKKHEAMKPRALKETRPEYAPFPLKIFRDHIQQEVRASIERPYWKARMEQKKNKK